MRGVRHPTTWLIVGFLIAASRLEGQTPGAETEFLRGFIFADVLYKSAEEGMTEGFFIGQTVAHANATLSENLVFFGEVSVTARSSGFTLAVERLILRYEFNDPLKVSAGRYHTPISFWNTEFHHGLWLQGSVSRPEAVKFGGSYLPVHFVGAMLEGNLTDVPLHYSAGFGNGRTEDLVGAGSAGDPLGSTAFVLAASLRPRGLFGFRVGGGAYFDRISEAGVEVADERILSGHLVWDRNNVEAIAEVFHVSHRELGVDEATGSPSWYVHVGYRLPTSVRLTPYARYEEISIDEQDVVFEDVLADYEAAIVGIRYDFESYAALKAEYRGEKVGDVGRTDSWFAQASFAIPVGGS
jgi:hypothetical protein